MKYKIPKEKRIYAILYLASVAVLILYLIAFADANRYSKSVQMNFFSDGWRTVSGKVYDNIDGVRTKEIGKTAVFEKELPRNIKNGDDLCFESKNLNLIVKINGRERYSFYTKENLTGRGYGVEYHEVGLSRADAGATVTLTYWGVRAGYGGGYILRPCICPMSKYIRYIATQKMMQVLLSIMIILFGFVLVSIYILVTDKNMLPFDVLALGATAVVIGIWLLVDTGLLQLFTGSIYVIRILHKVLPLFACYPIIAFFNSLTVPKRKIYLHIGFAGSVLLIIGFLASRYTYGMDMIDTFYVALWIMLVFLFTLIGIMARDNRIYCKKHDLVADLRATYVGFLIVLTCAVVDAVIYVLRLNSADTFGTFTRAGMIAFITIMLYQFLRWWTRDHISIERDRFINRALQYAVASNSPEVNIRNMIEFMGTELGGKRTFIFEEQKNGKFRGTYEWYEERLPKGGIDLVYLPFEGAVEILSRGFSGDGKGVIIENTESIRKSDPVLYGSLSDGHINSLVSSPLEVNGKLIGILGITDAPPETLKEISEILSLVSYFIAQLIMQREEQKRLYFYTYNDTLSGARNRRAFKKFMENDLDTSAAFGYIKLEINNLDDINDEMGYEEGDRLVVEVAKSLMGVFGEIGTYRMSGAEFVIFGFESDEVFFNNDLERVKKSIGEKNISVSIGAVYCANGTTNMDKVMNRASELMKIQS